MSEAKETKSRPSGQITLVFQGGGALGAYQAGVYQALHEAGIEPDWIIGTSIGAINASLIAGNAPSDRLTALQEFWARVQKKEPAGLWAAGLGIASAFTVNPFVDQENLSTFTNGIPGFFEPNLEAFLGGGQKRLGTARVGLYSTEPLRKTLTELVNFDLIDSSRPRLAVGAAEVATGRMRYFDSRDMRLSVDHVVASGALPPAFPPVLIDGAYYWDGGILSNTPIEAIFDDRERKSGTVFAVHVWNANGDNPETLFQVANRQKDIQYASRAASHVMRQKQIHRLRHIIKELEAHIPPSERDDPMVKELLSWGCLTRIHVVRLQAPPLENDNHLKDIDFTKRGIRTRWSLGYEHTMRAIEKSPWTVDPDPLEGVILHEGPDFVASLSTLGG
ncbi:MAG: patatin-like phospholipase family protein [Rhodomicrobium sp.]